MPYKLSPTSLNLFRQCSHCFWIRHNEKIKRPDAPFPSLPSGMDRILKHYFNTFRKEKKLPLSLTQAGITGELFQNEELLRSWQNSKRGLQYTDESGNILMGAVDEILQEAGKLVVLDYKTRGYPLKEDTAAHYQDQLNLYTYLLALNGHATSSYAYLLFYHPEQVIENNIVLFNADSVKMNIDIKAAETFFHDALQCLNGPKPNPNDTCSFCSWRLK